MAHVRSQAQEIINSMPYSPANPSDIKFFISRQWLNRFNTFAEPGPIDNWSILCQHGNLLPNKAANFGDLLVPLPQALWDFFYAEFGGGPVTNHPIECDTCKTRAADLERRQKNELLMFSELRDEFQYQDQSSLLAISMTWFRKWQAFARCETNEDPGPINNTTIALQSDVLPIRNVRPGSDYAQINLKLWRFFFDIYGGGPAIVLRGASEFAKVEKEADLADTTENLSLNDHEDDEASGNGDDDYETNEGVEELNNDDEEIKSATTATTKTILKLKPVKTVSFEDTKDLNSESDGEDISINTVNTAAAVVYKSDVKPLNGNERGKKSRKVKSVSIKPLDPREKKRREAQNGLFGAEGRIRIY